MTKLIDKLVVKRHYIVLDEWSVLGLISLINYTCKSTSKHKLTVGNCEWKNGSKWFVNFSCTNEQWRSIINRLHKEGFELIVKDETRSVHVVERVRAPFKRIEEENVYSV